MLLNQYYASLPTSGNMTLSVNN